MRWIVLVLIVFPSLCLAQVDPEKGLANWQKLVGEWQTRTEKKKYTKEVWQPDSVGYSGTDMEIKGDKTVFEEFLRLFIRDGTLYYSVRIPNQNKGAWIDFAMTEQSEKHWLFENPSHDFPRKIRYELVDDENLRVNVGGIDGGFTLEFVRRP